MNFDSIPDQDEQLAHTIFGAAFENNRPPLGAAYQL